MLRWGKRDSVCQAPQDKLLEAPIIIIGAGRSGTYLLERMLNAHPDILMYGLTNFLIPRLWQELWINSQHGLIRRLVADIYTGPEPTSRQEGRERRRSLPKEIEESERKRIGRLAGATVAELFGLPTDHEGRWGYREPWNGSASFRYSWISYDVAFPHAFWVQIIRNPFEFAVSCAAWNGDPFTASYREDRLRDWVAMIQWNRKRRDTDRYYECRYEDIIARPAEVLTPLLHRLDLPWHAACAAQLQYHPHRSVNRPDFPIATLKPVPGLSEAMEELGYEFPDLYRP